MTQFIITSLVLTVALNLLIRVPAVQGWISGLMQSGNRAEPPNPSDPANEPQAGRSSVKVYFPWKAMLIGSVLLTIVINVLGLFG